MNGVVRALKTDSPNPTKSGGKDMELEIVRDVTGESKSDSNVQNYVELFRDRLERLRGIISNEKTSVQLNGLRNYEGADVFLTGVVQERRRTRKEDWIVKVEDASGSATVWIGKKKEELSRRVETIVPDEVVGFDARVPSNLSGDRSPLVWGNEMYRPESWKLKNGNSSPEISRPDSPLAVLTSDWHVGSKEFLERPFRKFLNWLNGERGSSQERELAKRVEYLLVAGDSVDGGGVYPGQEKELEIHDVGKQYERVAEYLSEVPEDVAVVMGPGNHDPVRLAEPQPAISSDIGASLVDQGVTLVGNPCFFKIGDVRFLIYHGEGFDDLVSAGVGLEYSDREKLLVETLKRGHLAPVYRNSDETQAPTAPERKDYLVIDEPVDVFPAGHSHKFGVGEVNGVTLALTGTFQGQTSFQRSKGITPDPAKVVLVDLESGDVVTTLNFLEGR